MRLITIDDIIDIYLKVKQRGWHYVISKFNIDHLSKIRTTFNQSTIHHANWWIIPEVRTRWNKLITGDGSMIYEQYIMTKFLQKRERLRLLSVGSGVCSHELNLAEYDNFQEIICVDIAGNRLKEAKKIAKKRALTNIKFVCANILDYKLQAQYFDIILFHSSLHHFKNISNFISLKVKPSIKNSGLLIINEYVGPSKLQFPKNQIAAINEALLLIPEKYRVCFKTTRIKNKFYGPGILRMRLADPSESVDSENILPSIYSHFSIITEKPYGGNILMSVLKDISHNFLNLSAKKKDILKNLFVFEDNYLKYNNSDFIFGIYKKRNS